MVTGAPRRSSLTFSEGVAAVATTRCACSTRTGKRVDTGTATPTAAGTAPVPRRRCTPGCPTAPTPSPGRPSPRTATRSPAPSPSPSAPPPRPPSPCPSSGAGGGPWARCTASARYVAYAGFVLLVGGAAFVLACWPRGARLRPVQRLVVARLAHAHRGHPRAAAAARLLQRHRSSATPSTWRAARRCCRHQAGRRAGVPAAAARRGGAVHRGALRDAHGRSGRTTATERARTWPSGSPSAARRRRRARRDLGDGRARLRRDPARPRDAGRRRPPAGDGRLARRARRPADRAVPGAAADRRGGRPALLAARVRQRDSRWSPPGIYQSWRQLGSWSRAHRHPVRAAAAVKIGLVWCWSALAWFSRRWTARLSGRRRGAERRRTARGTGRRREDATAGGRRGQEAGPTADAPTGRDAPTPVPGGGAGHPARATRRRAAQLGPPARGSGRRSAPAKRPGRRPGRSGCAARCSPRRGSPWSCWPSPPCSPAPSRAARSRRPRRPPRRRRARPRPPGAPRTAAVRHRRPGGQGRGTVDPDPAARGRQRHAPGADRPDGKAVDAPKCRSPSPSPPSTSARCPSRPSRSAPGTGPRPTCSSRWQATGRSR